MATNVPTIKMLERISELIGKGKNTLSRDDVVKELHAWNRILKQHIGAQKRQEAKYGRDEYEYYESAGIVIRVKPSTKKM